MCLFSMHTDSCILSPYAEWKLEEQRENMSIQRNEILTISNLYWTYMGYWRHILINYTDMLTTYMHKCLLFWVSRHFTSLFSPYCTDDRPYMVQFGKLAWPSLFVFLWIEFLGSFEILGSEIPKKFPNTP